MSLLHTALLLALRSVQPYGLRVPDLLAQARIAGHRSATVPQVEAALRDLADRSLVIAMQGGLSERYRLTALGESTLIEEGV